MKKIVGCFLALVALFAFSCKQGTNVQEKKPSESNEITITVKETLIKARRAFNQRFPHFLKLP